MSLKLGLNGLLGFKIFLDVEFTDGAEHTNLEPFVQATLFVEDMLAWQLHDELIFLEGMLANRAALAGLRDLEFLK